MPDEATSLPAIPANLEPLSPNPGGIGTPDSLVDLLRYRADVDASAAVSECISSDAWNTDHYDTRLTAYYGPEGADRARAVLDVLAMSATPLSPDAIGAQVTARNPDLVLTRDDMLSLLSKLEKDHYLVREGTADRVSSDLLARIWRYHRRLT